MRQAKVQGTSLREIPNWRDISRNTVRKYAHALT